MNLEVLATPHAVAIRAADEVARAVALREDARIVLPAGATPVPMYAELVRRCRHSQLDLSAVHFFQLDEFVGVRQQDARSFSYFLGEHLLNVIAGRQDLHHRLDGASVAPDEEIARHGDLLAELGGADLVLLGLGQNGHLAFNEPGSRLEDGARVVELHGATIEALSGSFEPGDAPRYGLTLGLQDIFAGRRLVLMVTGTAKASTLKRVLDESSDPTLPASLILTHRSLSIFGDSQAAQLVMQ